MSATKGHYPWPAAEEKDHQPLEGYHGSGLFHKKFDLPLSQVIHTEAPYYFRRKDAGMTEEQFSAHCAEELEKLIMAEGGDTIAAFIGEPVLGTGGIVPPPAGYWEAIQKVFDVPLVVAVTAATTAALMEFSK